MAESIDASIIGEAVTGTSPITATITYSNSSGSTVSETILVTNGIEVVEETTAQLITPNTTTAEITFTFTGTDVYWHPQYDAKAEKRSEELLKECFPELYKQYKKYGHCEFDSNLYPVRYILTPSRVYVEYREKSIGFVCVAASYSMPPADRILQMILHFRKDEAYVLRIGNWNANIGHTALEHFKKSFVKKGGKLIYRPKKEKKRAWWDIGNIDWMGWDL